MRFVKWDDENAEHERISILQREDERPTQPQKHFGLLLETGSQPSTRKNVAFQSGFTNLGSANNHMKLLAKEHVNKFQPSKMSTNEMEFVDSDGSVALRYFIAEGRWIEKCYVQDNLELPQHLLAPGNHEQSESVEHAQDHPQAHIIAPLDVLLAKVTAHLSQPLQGESQLPVEAPPTMLPAPVASPTVETASTATATSPSPTKPTTEPLYCRCRRPDDGSLMIGCKNDGCPVGWYHTHCVNITEAPEDKDKWWCPVC